MHLPTSALMRVLVAVVTTAVLTALLPFSVASAQTITIPQHELLLAVEFDGTAAFSPSDVFDDGLGAHTPGLDLNANNNVVRTNDQMGYAIHWNTNEADANNVTINVTLPDGMTWLPDATTVFGAPAGCTDDNTSSITGNGGRDLVCVVNNLQIEGSNGTIHPRAFVGSFVDGDALQLTGTIQSDENTTAKMSNTLETIVSAAPAGDWQKGEAIVDTVSGDVVGFEPDEVHLAIPNDAGEIGTVFVWNLRLIPTGGLKGLEPMNDAAAIRFWDHFFDAVPSTQLADATAMAAIGPNSLGQTRVNCGGYDGDGGYPYGQTAGVPSTTPAAQTNIGLWTCTDLGSPNGYPLIQIDITGQDTQNIAAQNADLGPNSNVLTSGQIAFWSSDVDLLAKDPEIIQNAIAGNNFPITLPGAEVDPIDIIGTTMTVDESVADSGSGTMAGLSNTTPFPYVLTPPGNPGRSFRHAVSYFNGPYQEVEYQALGTETMRWYDHRRAVQSGTGRYVPDATGNIDGGTNTFWDGDATTPRGNVLTVVANIRSLVNGAGGSYAEPIHQCVAIDTTHQEVIGLPPTFPISVLGQTFNGSPGTPLNTARVINNRDVVGGTVGTPTSPVANLNIGFQGVPISSNGPNTGGVTIDRGAPTYHLEVSGTPLATGNAVANNALSCNDADGPWIDAVSGDLSSFITGTAADGSAIYGGITRFRVRTEGNVPWNGFIHPTSPNLQYGTAAMLGFQVRVKDSPTAQAAGQELHVYSSRASGVWDGTGQPPTPTCSNGTVGVNPATGWCNLEYFDDGTSSTDLADSQSDYDVTAIEFASTAGVPSLAHADKVYIVEAALAVSKFNTAGPSEILANGNITEFGISPAVVGSSLDEIDAVVLTDTLPPTMAFVGFTSQPATGGPCTVSGGTSVVSPIDPTQTVTVGGTITCNYGDDLAGGWGLLGEGDFTFEVMIVGAEANDQLTNTTTLRGNDGPSGEPKVPATSRASVFTGAPFDESVIVKAVDTGKGDCVTYPAGPVDAPSLIAEPADWADRCELIEFENAPGSGASTMGFILEMANQGNTDLSGIRFVDVLPHNADEVENNSNTVNQGIPVPTLGDGRAPETDHAGTLTYSSFTGDVQSVWVTGDAPLTISRDPDFAIFNTVWCDVPGGTVQNGVAGACPATNADVTGIYAVMDLSLIHI